MGVARARGRGAVARSVPPPGRVACCCFPPPPLPPRLAGTLPSLPSSALARLGDTLVMCAVRPVLARPAAATPDAGIVDVSVQVSGTVDAALSPMQPGGGRYPPSALDWAESLSELFAKGALVDLKQLCVLPGKAAWCIRCELVVLLSDGCELDACVAAAAAALHGCPLVMPPALASACAHEAGAAGPSAASSLSLKALPVPVTTAVVFGKTLVDPSAVEAAQASGTALHVVALKPGQRAGDGAVLLLRADGPGADAAAADAALELRWGQMWGKA